MGVGGVSADSGAKANRFGAFAAAPGADFSEEKGEKLGVGDGILPPDRISPEQERATKTDKLVDKANSLLNDMSREERSGYKGQISGLGAYADKSSEKPSPDRSD